MKSAARNGLIRSMEKEIKSSIERANRLELLANEHVIPRDKVVWLQIKHERDSAKAYKRILEGIKKAWDL